MLGLLDAVLGEVGGWQRDFVVPRAAEHQQDRVIEDFDRVGVRINVEGVYFMKAAGPAPDANFFIDLKRPLVRTQDGPHNYRGYQMMMTEPLPAWVPFVVVTFVAPVM